MQRSATWPQITPLCGGGGGGGRGEGLAQADANSYEDVHK